LNRTISVTIKSVTPPLKSAQTRKIFSVAVIAPSLGQFGPQEAVTNIVEALGRQETAFDASSAVMCTDDSSEKKPSQRQRLRVA
jgi:hypothetical protein